MLCLRLSKLYGHLVILLFFATSLSAAPRVVGDEPAPVLHAGLDAAPTPAERLEAVLREMETRFDPLDQACDFRAPFALTYLMMTNSVLDALYADFYDDPEWVGRLDSTFAQLYFQWFDRYAGGDPPPEPWRYAFERAEGQLNNVLQDAMLGINAHINYDLPLALHREGLAGKEASHRADYNRVNPLLQSTAIPLVTELARHYDPSLYLLRWFGRSLTELLTVIVFGLWREEAWQNAVRLDAAGSDEAFEAIRSELEQRALARAQEIAPPESRTDPRGRLLYCRLRHGE